MAGSTSQAVRVRFAPSPTGFLHVGGARTMFFNWLYAKRMGGKFILRVEDTDRARSTPEHEKMILSDIYRLGFTPDEGPDQGGKFGPYRQSERMSLYADVARDLLKRDLVYYCFCPEELLTQKREAALKMGRMPHYDGTCRKLSRKEAETKLAAGERAGLRFKTPDKSMFMKDHVRGEIEFKAGTVGDFFVTRTPTAHETEIAEGIGMPVYNFCCVIDDHLMQMSHVIRGEEHLSNTSRQLMIYDAFGWAVPDFAHTAMVLGADRQKLSKRNGDTSVQDYLGKGYLQEALLNFLVLLGWWPKDTSKTKSGHPEILSMEEITAAFELKGLQKSPAVFDIQKLDWMNSFYLRHMPVAELARRCEPFFEKEVLERGEGYVSSLVGALKGEVTKLSEFSGVAQSFLSAQPSIEPEGVTVLRESTASQVVAALENEIGKLSETVEAAQVELLIKEVGLKTGLKGKSLFMPMRVVVTGKTHGPELKFVVPLLGKKRTLERIQEIKSLVGS